MTYSQKPDSALKEKSYSFAIRVVNMSQYLISTKKEYILSKQILRSGTAIGALIAESRRAESTVDFIHKLNIALKEADETLFGFPYSKTRHSLTKKCTPACRVMLKNSSPCSFHPSKHRSLKFKVQNAKCKVRKTNHFEL